MNEDNPEEFVDKILEIDGAAMSLRYLLDELKTREQVPLVIMLGNNEERYIWVSLIEKTAFLCCPERGMADLYYYSGIKKMSIPKVSLVSN